MVIEKVSEYRDLVAALPACGGWCVYLSNYRHTHPPESWQRVRANGFAAELTATGPLLGVASDRQYPNVGACLLFLPRSDPSSGGVSVFWASGKKSNTPSVTYMYIFRIAHIYI